MQTKKEMRGGKRPLSGAKKKYGEETTTVSFRVPVSKANAIKILVNNFLKKIVK
jgi:hypothetical protein